MTTTGRARTPPQAGRPVRLRITDQALQRQRLEREPLCRVPSGLTHRCTTCLRLITRLAPCVPRWHIPLLPCRNRRRGRVALLHDPILPSPHHHPSTTPGQRLETVGLPPRYLPRCAVAGLRVHLYHGESRCASPAPWHILAAYPPRRRAACARCEWAVTGVLDVACPSYRIEAACACSCTHTTADRAFRYWKCMCGMCPSQPARPIV